MHSVRRHPAPWPVWQRSAPALAGQLVVLMGGSLLAGLRPASVVVAIIVTLAVDVLLIRALRKRCRLPRPADWVTLLRATLVAVVAGIVWTEATSSGSPVWLVTVSAIALILDFVDGRVARATGTVSELGARFDMEIDAFLILLLSCSVAAGGRLWVLPIGLARYGFWAAQVALPWLRNATPPRYWCKVVAAFQGIVLVVAASDLLPDLFVDGALVLAMALLAESFGRDVGWLWRQRRNVSDPTLGVSVRRQSEPGPPAEDREVIVAGHRSG